MTRRFHRFWLLTGLFAALILIAGCGGGPSGGGPGDGNGAPTVEYDRTGTLRVELTDDSTPEQEVMADLTLYTVSGTKDGQFFNTAAWTDDPGTLSYEDDDARAQMVLLGWETGNPFVGGPFVTLVFTVHETDDGELYHKIQGIAYWENAPAMDAFEPIHPEDELVDFPLPDWISLEEWAEPGEKEFTWELEGDTARAQGNFGGHLIPAPEETATPMQDDDFFGDVLGIRGTYDITDAVRLDSFVDDN